MGQKVDHYTDDFGMAGNEKKSGMVACWHSSKTSLKKHGSEGQDDFGMARKSNSGMKKLTCAAQKHIVRRIVLILMPTS